MIEISIEPYKDREMEPDQPNYAKGGENFANEPPLQLTLRVMQDIYSNARFWIGALAVTAILTVAGPFDTLNDMEFAPRLVYWAAISLATWPMGMASSIYFGTSLFQQGVPEILSRMIGGLIGGIPIVAEIIRTLPLRSVCTTATIKTF